MIQRLCILGVGLIGGSLAAALKQAGAVGEVVGWGRREVHLQQAVDLGVIDRLEMDLGAAVAGADVVVVAVSPLAMEQVFNTLAPLLDPHTVLTDVGSTKGSVVAAAQAAFPDRLDRFVPGHPIAGAERHGVTAARADLYQHHRVLLTPLEQTRADAVTTIREMWQACGAEVVEMDVAHHDQVLAATSHLPHLLAYTLVDTLAGIDDSREVFEFAAGGFRDFTRIASSDPALWRDISLANADALLDMIARFQKELEQVTAALKAGDGDALQSTFSRARDAREHFMRLTEAR